MGIGAKDRDRRADSFQNLPVTQNQTIQLGLDAIYFAAIDGNAKKLTPEQRDFPQFDTGIGVEGGCHDLTLDRFGAIRGGRARQRFGQHGERQDLGLRSVSVNDLQVAIAPPERQWHMVYSGLQAP